MCSRLAANAAQLTSDIYVQPTGKHAYYWEVTEVRTMALA